MNIYLEKFGDKSKQELEEILRNEDKYDAAAIEAAKELLNGGARNTIKATSPTTSKFVFKTNSDSFPQLRYIGYAGIFIGLVKISTDGLIGIIIAIISIIIVMAFRPIKRILELNNNTVTPRSLFGSASEHFNKIERLDIKSTPVTQRLNSRGSTTEIRYELFQAYLVSDGTRILLGEEKTKKRLIEQLNRISALTNSPINDET